MNLYYRIIGFFEDCWLKFKRSCQRFKRGYSYSDVWNMDHWFINTVKPMLMHLRDYGIGIPSELYVEYVDGGNERERWETVLTEMIECLELMDEDTAEKYLGIADNDWSAASYEKVRNLMSEKKDYFFELFSEYFYHLWD